MTTEKKNREREPIGALRPETPGQFESFIKSETIRFGGFFTDNEQAEYFAMLPVNTQQKMEMLRSFDKEAQRFAPPSATEDSDDVITQPTRKVIRSSE